MSVSDICWEDMAVGLAVPRFGGHALPGADGNRIYSIAQHSVVLHDYFAPIDSYSARYALLHDAEEAYMGDIHGPLKHGLAYVQHVQTANYITDAILAFAGPTMQHLPAECRNRVHTADKLLVEAELHYHFGPAYSDAIAQGLLGRRPVPLSVPSQSLYPLTRRAAIALWLSSCALYWPAADRVDASAL